jgi:flagellar biosynthesis component FlhA
MVRPFIVPAVVVGMLGSLLLPLPPGIVDLMLVGNLLLALVLLISTLYITDPLKLSSLPTILLLATLYRLALNISTTRLILGRGDAGRVIEAFGAVVIQGDFIVGVVIFLIITFIQFVVIAKGAERVAEVSARFTLDALPGKQLSIDADVRAGLIDFEQARKKRHDLQTESRFYGALDGAMKFVKGDAIAGLVIVCINSLGGAAIGCFVHGLGMGAAVGRYTLLTVGDGLVCQIPALLNSLAAGMVVTRVVSAENVSLSEEVMTQLWQARRVKGFVALVALILALLPGMPFLPFVSLAAVLCVSAIISPSEADARAGAVEQRAVFRPKMPAVLEVQLGAGLAKSLHAAGQTAQLAALFQQGVYDRYGLMLAPPEFSLAPLPERAYAIYVRGVQAVSAGVEECSAEVWPSIGKALEGLVQRRTAEFMDDIHTRRILDHFDRYAPELVSTVVPGVIAVTQLTEILKNLVREGVSVRSFDLILQAVAEHGAKAGNERGLLEEVRVALRRVVCDTYARDGALQGYVLDPTIDLAFVKSEREGKSVDFDWVTRIEEWLKSRDTEGRVLLVSKGARRLLRECLEMRGLNLPLLAHEELVEEVRFASQGRIEFEDMEFREKLMEGLSC